MIKINGFLKLIIVASSIFLLMPVLGFLDVLGCTSDSDCVQGNCVAGQCYTCGPNTTCVTPGYTCQNGTCAPPAGAPRDPACEVNYSCPAGTYPDWSAPVANCGHWGKVCGNAARRPATLPINCDAYCNCPGPDCQRPCKMSAVDFATCRPLATPTPTPTPIPRGTLRARAWKIADADISCSAVYAASASSIPTSYTTSPSLGAAKVQADASYVTWPNAQAQTYTLLPAPPAGWVLQTACWGRDLTAPLSGTGLAASFANGETLSFDLGYTLGEPWSQVVGGDVYAGTTLTNPVPVGTTPRKMVRDGTSAPAGLVTYGGTIDLDSDILLTGEDLVSAMNWLAKDTSRTRDHYQYFYRRFGGTPLAVDYDHPTTPVVQPPPQTKADGSPIPYYVTGDMETSGDWLIPSGETLVFFVDGNLTIGGSLHVSGGGFLAFLVNGNITVLPAVGVPSTSTTPVVEGVYITKPTGIFATGKSTSAGHERLVVRGMVVAGAIRLQRNLDTLGQNNAEPAELFLYEPRFLVAMPEKLKDAKIVWREVAP